jgi:hypothetical protein
MESAFLLSPPPVPNSTRSENFSLMEGELRQHATCILFPRPQTPFTHPKAESRLGLPELLPCFARSCPYKPRSCVNAFTKWSDLSRDLQIAAEDVMPRKTISDLANAFGQCGMMPGTFSSRPESLNDSVRTTYHRESLPAHCGPNKKNSVNCASILRLSLILGSVSKSWQIRFSSA